MNTAVAALGLYRTAAGASSPRCPGQGTADGEVGTATVWTLRKKILVGYGVAVALVAGVLVLALVNFLALGNAGDAILRENYNSAIAAENMIDAIERQDSAMLLLVLGYDERGLQQFSQNESQFLQWLARAKDNVTIEGEEAIVQRIDSGYASYLRACSDLRTIHHLDTATAPETYYRDVLPVFEAVRAECIRLREINETAMTRASTQARLVAEQAVWTMAAVGAVSIAVGLTFSLFLSMRLVRPLREIMVAAQRVADGDDDAQVAAGSADELGRLAGEFNVMVRKLKAYHDMNLERFAAETQKSAAIIQSIDDGIVLVDAEQPRRGASLRGEWGAGGGEARPGAGGRR